MKKLFILMFAAVLLAACGNDEPKTEGTTKVETAKQESKPEEKKASKEFFFDGKTAKIEMLEIKIKDTKVIPVGQKGNEYGEKPVLAIWYDTTNFTDEDIDPISAWLAVFEAVQDNDKNMVNSLTIGMLPDEAHQNSQLNTIKKDGTVENSIAYELDDQVTPVTLIAKQGIEGDEIGRHNYEIK